MDDNPFNMLPLEHMLRKEFEIETVSFDNAKDALSCYVRRLQNKCCWRSFKLILTDIQMPEMDGFKFAETLCFYNKYYVDKLIKDLGYRKTKAKKMCPIVAVTAYQSD